MWVDPARDARVAVRASATERGWRNFARLRRVFLVMSRRVATLRIAALAGGAVLLTTPAQSAALPRTAGTHRATCDEIPGASEAVNDRWRIFRPAGRADPGVSPEIWACERPAAVARRVLELTPLGVNTAGLAGNVVAIEWSGRYSNYGGTFLDLSTLRGAPRYGQYPVSPNATLLDSGAIVSLPVNAEGRDETDPIPDGRRAGELTVVDSIGKHVIEPGSTWTADAKTFLSVVPAASGVLSFGTGFYYTAADGSLRRHVPAGGPASTAAWGRTHRVRWRRYAGRVPDRQGVRTTYVGLRELRARAAHAGRPATLTLHAPHGDDQGDGRRTPDLVARLVPGSERELQLQGALVIGRFADRPTERRLRLPIQGRANRFAVDLPAPATIDDTSSDEEGGDIVLLDGTELVFLMRQERDFSYVVRREPAPPGFRDPVLVPPSSRDPGELRYTAADGVPARLVYRGPDPEES